MAHDDKFCKGCGETKAPGEFYRKSRNRDGLDNLCKTCRKRKKAQRRAQEINDQATYARAGAQRAGRWTGKRAVFVMWNYGFDVCGELRRQDLTGMFAKPWARWGTIMGMDEQGNIRIRLDNPLMDSNNIGQETITVAPYRVFILAAACEQPVSRVEVAQEGVAA